MLRGHGPLRTPWFFRNSSFAALCSARSPQTLPTGRCCEEFTAEFALQKGLVAALLKRLYGAKSEKMSHDQLLLEFLKDEGTMPDATAGTDVPPVAEALPPKIRARRMSKLSASLKGPPTVTREFILIAVLAAPDDFRLLGGETSERLTHICKNEIDAVPLTPQLDSRLLPGSVLKPSLGAHLLTQKFCYHSTFYREQWKLRAAHVIELTRNLICSWHDRLRPPYRLLATRFRRSDHVKADAPPIRCLNPGKGKTTLGYFWVYHHAEHGVPFD